MGGFTGSIVLDSTETFDSGGGGWATGAKLPRPMYGLSAANIDDRVLIFGSCQALVPNPKPISPQSLQTQSKPNPTQFKTQINPKGTGADTKIL